MTLTFGIAIEETKTGKRAARKWWNDKGMFIFIQRGIEVKKEDVRREQLKKLDRDVKISAHIDMLSDDWMIVE